MAWQLIFTSAPRGLTPGQTGFCTVARSPDIREALAQRLEQVSYYEHPLVTSKETKSQPVISAFRILDIRGTPYYVLTKVRDAGLDFTNRTNHLAHHLVFEEKELNSLADPAAILLYWNGWCERWNGEPRLIPRAVDFNQIPGDQSSSAQTWGFISGDSARAAALVEPPSSRGVFLISDNLDERVILQLFSESLRLRTSEGAASDAWRFPFTTFFQAGDLVSDFVWRCCQSQSTALEQATRSSQRPIQLTQLPIPKGAKVQRARMGSTPKVARGQQPARSMPSEPLLAAAPASVVRPAQEMPEGKEERAPVWKDPIIAGGVLLLGIIAIVLIFLHPEYFGMRPPADAQANDKADTTAEQKGGTPEIARIQPNPNAPPDKHTLFYLTAHDFQGNLMSLNVPLHILPPGRAVIPTNWAGFKEFLGPDGKAWIVSFHSNGDKERKTNAKVDRGPKKVVVSSGLTSIALAPQDDGAIEITSRADASLLVSFTDPVGTNATFLIGLLRGGPILSLAKPFHADVQNSRIGLDLQVEAFLRRQFPGFELGWRLPKSSVQLPLQADVPVELAKARSEAARAKRDAELIDSRIHDAARQPVITTNQLPTFDQFSQRQRTPIRFIQYLIALLQGQPPALCQQLTTILSAGENRSVFREAFTVLSNRYPESIHVRMDFFEKFFEDLLRKPALERASREAENKSNDLVNWTAAPTHITLVLSQQNSEYDLIRISPAAPSP